MDPHGTVRGGGVMLLACPDRACAVLNPPDSVRCVECGKRLVPAAKKRVKVAA